MPLHLHPSTALVLASVLGIAIACLAMAVGLLWTRVQSLRSHGATHSVDELTRRQESMEVRLSAIDEARAVSPMATHVGYPLHPRPTSMAVPGPSQVQRVDLAETAASGPTLIAVPSLSTSVANASASAAEELGRRFGAIWALADVGETADSIARTTGQPIGQVELILGLRRQLSQVGQSGSSA